MLAKGAAVFAILAGILLSSCARTPPLVSDDGGRILLGRSSFSYEKPGTPATLCRFDAGSKRWICEDGTASKLVVAGLPFKGILLVEFDGKRFLRAEHR